MEPPFPCPTTTWHNDSYTAIEPTRPEVNAKYKTVIITGAGTGIGQATAQAFATAGASRLILIGRTESSLYDTKKSLPPQVTSVVYRADVTDEKAFKAIASDIGTWDVLILNAGTLAAPNPIANTTIDDWWASFEVNVKGSLVPAKALLSTANPERAVILGVSSGSIAFPVAMAPGVSDSISSKLAQAKMLEYLAAENPNIFVASLHPGLVKTTLFNKMGPMGATLPTDQVQLPAKFMVWLASPEAAFLKGRMVWANWDVEELKTQAEKIQSGTVMTIGVGGWPYMPS